MTLSVSRLAVTKTFTGVGSTGPKNGWSPTAHPMKRRKDGRFSTTVSLKAGETYRFRYMLDDTTWENDWAADGCEGWSFQEVLPSFKRLEDWEGEASDLEIDPRAELVRRLRQFIVYN